jgi:hypothetical protein
MDDYNAVIAAAFEDELEKIGMAELEKTAGIGSFLMKGIKGWQGAAKGAAQAAKGAGGRTWGSHLGSIKKMYQQGAKKGGMWGGVKRVAKSPYGAMAGTAGVGGLAAYGGLNAISGGGGQLRQGY